MNVLNGYGVRQLWTKTVAVWATWTSCSIVANAANPSAEFDLGYTVECRDVTPQEFAQSHPTEKMLEANLRISVRLSRGDEQDVEQLSFEVANPTECLRIVDFLPRTRLESDAGDGIEVTKTTETVHTLGVSGGSGVSISANSGKSHGSLGAQFAPSANATANTTHRDELKETSKRIPPGKVVVVSGTMHNEHGVFFKFKHSSTESFEGEKAVSFRFLVPADWRGDWMVVSAKALSTTKRSWFFKAAEPCGETKAIVGLYLAGAAAAERAAVEAAQAQQLYLGTQDGKKNANPVITQLSLTASSWRTAGPRKAVAPSRTAQATTCRKLRFIGLIGASGARIASGLASEDAALELWKDALHRLAYSATPAARSPRPIQLR